MKLFHVIATSVLGTAMALCTGFALANKQNVRQTRAATSDFTLSSADSVTQDGITVSFADGGGTAPAWYNAGLRLYASNTITISSAASITGISFNWEKQGKKDFASLTASTGTYTHPSNTGTGTWSGTSSSITFTLGSSGQLQLNTFSVTTGGSVDPDPDPEPTTDHAGTSADPYSVADAKAVINTLTDNVITTDSYYVQGFITKITYQYTSQNGVTFLLGDTASTADADTVTCFKVKDSNSKIAVGAEVKMQAKLEKYVKNSTVTPELVNVTTPITIVHEAPEPEPEYTSISWFYEEGNISQTSSGPYTFKGTVIGIQSNTYYLQQDQHGIMVYGGTITPPEGMKIGDLVEVTAKVLNYKDHLVETDSKSSITAKILGTGTMPAATVVSTATAFAAVNQSTYVTFNGLKLQSAPITWSSTFTSKSSDGIATISDSDGNSITIFVSKHLDNGADIVAAMDAIVATDTFDIAKGVRAVNSNNGEAQLAILDEKQITVHHQGSDLVQDWIDEYMFMDDESFDGDGTGKCISDNLYITAKRALIALGEENVTKFRTNDGNKYTDALARYNEWARINGDTKPFEGNEIVPASLVIGNNTVQSNLAVVIVTMSVVALVSSVGFFLVIRKRKHQ